MRSLFLTVLIGTFGFTVGAAAQVAPDVDRRNAPFQMPTPGDEIPPPQIEMPRIDVAPEDVPLEATEPDTPDYSKLPPSAERQARLDGLFTRLGAESDADTANLIAEEIWAIWLDSGSASVNLVLRRGSDAQAKGDAVLARRMFDHTTTLSPQFAEGWARSSRLALEDKNFDRALNEAIKTLALEPRHFYALWTMGNVFEQLGRNEDALEAYREANKLYPELKAVKERLEEMEKDVEGTVL